MLTDNITMLSSWCLDNILLQDVPTDSCWKYSPEKTTNDTDFLLLEDSGIERIKQFHDYCAVNLSTGSSVASSECSDDLYLDLECDVEVDLFGDLASSVLNLIQDIKDSDDSTDHDVDFPCDTCPSSTPQPIKEPSSIDLSCNNCSNYSLKQKPHKKTDRKWNELSEQEKVIIVDQISQSISQNLGLREQLEVIRIIDPKSRVSPTDGQFLIDITNMTEEKIQKIQDYIKTHTCTDCLSDDSISEVSPRKNKKKQQSQDKKNRHSMHKQRQRKEYRQIMKEKRSGLFVKEEVLSVSRLSPPPEEEDIDILG